jgi:ABC-type Na+ efflux pump permease subunit
VTVNLRAALFLARKDLQYMLRTRETLLWTFLMPPMFFYFIGTVTGGFAGGASGPTPLVVEVAPDAGFLETHLRARLEKVGYRILPPPAPDERRPSAARLRIPPAFTDSVLAGHPATLVLERKKGGIGADFDKYRILRASFTVLADLVAATEVGGTATREELDILTGAPGGVRLEIAPAGRRREAPSGFEQAVPGTTVMFTLLVLLTSGSVLLVLEREGGLLRRLAAAPLSRGTVLLGKWGGRLALGLIQLGSAMLLGTLLFGMRWGPNLPLLLVVLVVYAALVAFLGIILGSLARTSGQAVAIGVLASNFLAALGGCWWPIEIVPGWMQKLALLLPTGWAMDALHKLVSFGAPPLDVLPNLAVTLAATVVAAWGATRLFRFQ